MALHDLRLSTSILLYIVASVSPELNRKQLFFGTLTLTSRRGAVAMRMKGKMPTVQRKARFVGRLVPGYREETLPVILEEAGDYIEALEKEV
ncbi:hypothetical protein Droror1_Dr00008752 [Drosera rotundifolia]